MSKMQAGYGKLSLGDIHDLSSQEYVFGRETPDKSTYFWMNTPLKTEALFTPKNNADRLFVLFCGDAERQRYTPPVFQRWKWAERFPGHCLFVSDPTLYLNDDLGLAWYCGTPDFDPLQGIAEMARDIATCSGIPESKIILYGSSGGGFAALRLTSILTQATAVVINPQINILNFSSQSKVDFCMESCFPGLSREEIERDHGDRINLMHDKFDFQNKKLIYAQNKLDKSHYFRHYMPFLEKLGINGRQEFKSDRLKTILFENVDGHPKAEAGNPEVFDRMIDLITTG